MRRTARKRMQRAVRSMTDWIKSHRHRAPSSNLVQLLLDTHALLPHRDRFDRVLAGQSEQEGMPLVTRDPAFELFGIRTLW